MISNIRKKNDSDTDSDEDNMTLAELKLLKNWKSYLSPGFSNDQFSDIENPNSSLNSLHNISLDISSDKEQGCSQIDNDIQNEQIVPLDTATVSNADNTEHVGDSAKPSRKRDEANWKRSIAKRKRNRGEIYTSRKGKEVPARQVKAGCGINCR